MDTVTLELPADLVSIAKLDQGNVSQEAAKLIALELFREGTVSIGRAAELCLTPLAAFMDFAAAQGLPPQLPILSGDKDLLSALENRARLCSVGS